MPQAPQPPLSRPKSPAAFMAGAFLLFASDFYQEMFRLRGKPTQLSFDYQNEDTDDDGKGF
jgi:hypothetical protein